jgi:hypothetical protein
VVTSKEAKLLLVGTVVMWNGNPHDTGVVRRRNSSGFYVDWQNGERGWIDYRDAEKISLSSHKASKIS